jgi:transposase-like protein
MAESKCSRCLQVISPDETVQFRDDRVVHLDCQRPRELTREERILLFRYCWGHPVAKCPACDQSFRQHQLGSDLLGHRSHLCPRCRTDLTESLRGHLYACTMLPEEVQRRAQDVRDTARRLAKHSSQLRDLADVLMREAEAATAALRETMQRTTWRN